MDRKIIGLILTVLFCLVGKSVFAYDFEAKNSDGVTIYYNYINDGKELEVTNNYSDRYEGSVIIPEEATYMSRTRKVTRIGEMAFHGCSGLTSITIPNSVKSLEHFAFSGCSSLTSVTIPNSVTLIGARAFERCSRLNSITIPNSVTWIGNDAFSGCSGLTSITIPNSVKYLASWAFSYCSNLTSVTLSDSMTSIEECVFYYCKKLATITIPNSITSIKERAFTDCKSLISITFPNSVTNIEGLAFQGCSSLSSVTIPNSMTRFGDGAFIGCDELTSVHISDLEAWFKISFGSKPLSPAYHLYLNGQEIKDLVIPNSVSSIGDFVFQGCCGLSSVTIPNTVTTIGIGAFYGCSGLTSITIPNSVTSIGIGAFSGWDLPIVISKIENPFDIPTNTFNDNTFFNATLYVPKGTVEKYKDTEGWKKFTFIEEDSPSSIANINGDGTNEYRRYSIDGKVVKNPHKGINIIQMNDGKVKKVLVK